MLVSGLTATSSALAQSKSPAESPAEPAESPKPFQDPPPEPEPVESSAPLQEQAPEDAPNASDDSFFDPNWNPDWEEQWAANEAAPQTIVNGPDDEPPLDENPVVPIIGESFIALLGATASAAGGFGLAYVTNKGCINDSSTNALAAPFGCGLETAAADLLVWVPGGIFLTPFLVHTVAAGAGSYGDGVLGALVGATGGTAIGVALLKGLNPENKTLGAVLFGVPIVLLNAAGAVVGYELGVGENSSLTRTPAGKSAGTLTIAPWVSAETRGFAFTGTF